MTGDSVLFEVNKKIATLTLNRPKRGNVLNREMITRLERYLNEISEREDINVVILTGQGEYHFCQGVDIVQLSTLKDKDVEEFLLSVNNLGTRIESLPQPVICAVNGQCYGTGSELMLACDFKVGANRASFCINEVSIGTIPASGATQRLCRLVGLQRAKEIILTGRKISSFEARDIGVYLSINNEVMKEAMVLAKQMNNKPFGALTLAKKAINEGYDLPLEQGMRLERELFRRTYYSRERIAAMDTALEKINPA